MLILGADGGQPNPKLIDRQVLAVVALAIVVRFAWVALFARTPTGLSDPALYNDAANRLVAGEGYRSLLGEPTAYYPPGYPAVLSWIYRLADAIGFGAHRATVVGVFQSLWWGVSAGAVTLTGRWVAGARTGLAAGLVVALWPNLIAHAGAHLTESLFVMLVSVCIAVGRPQSRCRWWRDADIDEQRHQPVHWLQRRGNGCLRSVRWLRHWRTVCRRPRRRAADRCREPSPGARLHLRRTARRTCTDGAKVLGDLRDRRRRPPSERVVRCRRNYAAGRPEHVASGNDRVVHSDYVRRDRWACIVIPPASAAARTSGDAHRPDDTCCVARRAAPRLR